MIHRNATVIRSRLVRGAVFGAIVLIAGCAGSGGAVREKTAQEWYDEGTQQAAKERYDQALEAFRQASRGYRGAELDADIQLALADTYFRQKDYAAAVEAYAGFLRLHPHNPRADYAQASIGQAWLRQMRSPDRSQEPAHSAVAAFETLLRSYPRSSHLEAGREGLAAARRRIAEHEMRVGDFYQRTGSWRAAAGRYDLVVQRYADLGFSDRALYEQGRCLERLKEPEQAVRLFEQLRREYPQSRYVKELDKSKG